MREILFRGKTKNGEWFEGSLMKYTVETPTKREEHYKIQETFYGFTDESNMPFFCDYMSGFDEEVIPETVGQYTGLKDKNGNKIFEGDIILTGDFWSELTYVVEWDNDGSGFNPFRRCFEVSRGCTFICADDYEVIGNIYDNPELLEEKL